MKSILKNSLLMLAVAVTAVAQSGNAVAQLADGDAQAVVNLDNGEVTVSFGSGLLIFGLEGAPFVNANATTPLLAIDPTGLGTQNDAAGIGVVSFSGLPTGEFNLGAIIPEGSRTEASLADSGFLFRFDGPSNTDPQNAINSGNVTFVGGGPNGVPEPGSLSLLALAGLGVVARRRR